jgi:hypothetical protein
MSEQEFYHRYGGLHEDSAVIVDAIAIIAIIRCTTRACIEVVS